MLVRELSVISYASYSVPFYVVRVKRNTVSILKRLNIECFVEYTFLVYLIFHREYLEVHILFMCISWLSFIVEEF